MPMEIDFLGLEKTQTQQEHQAPTDSLKPSSIRDLQNAASRLNPNYLKSIISQPTGPQAAPVPPSAAKTAPLTIFYNGTISYFEATADVVANLMKMAEEGKVQPVQPVQPKHKKEMEQPQHQEREILIDGFNTDSNGDMPLYRKKSLQRFFEKRKQRLTSTAPCPTSSYSSVGDVDEYVSQKNLLRKTRTRWSRASRCPPLLQQLDQREVENSK